MFVQYRRFAITHRRLSSNSLWTSSKISSLEKATNSCVWQVVWWSGYSFLTYLFRMVTRRERRVRKLWTTSINLVLNILYSFWRREQGYVDFIMYRKYYIPYFLQGVGINLFVSTRELNREGAYTDHRRRILSLFLIPILTLTKTFRYKMWNWCGVNITHPFWFV